mgnify:CR=1 FL=1
MPTTIVMTSTMEEIIESTKNAQDALRFTHRMGHETGEADGRKEERAWWIAHIGSFGLCVDVPELNGGDPYSTYQIQAPLGKVLTDTGEIIDDPRTKTNAPTES